MCKDEDGDVSVWNHKGLKPVYQSGGSLGHNIWSENDNLNKDSWECLVDNTVEYRHMHLDPSLLDLVVNGGCVLIENMKGLY